jgi:hypothetical protein
MAPKTGTVGGGPATGLAKDFTGWLDKALNTGTFGSGGGTGDPTGDTRGFTGVLNDILSAGGGQFGGALGELIKQRQTADIGDLRARFGASGGMAFGTPAAYAESQYRAAAAPQAATAIGQLQLSALQPILQALMGLSGMGIPQAQAYVSPNPWLSGVEALGGLATGVGDLAKGLKKP